MTRSTATPADQDAPGRPLVSIGVPVYNGADRLAEALASALAQEYAPLEVIICDNASTDETEAIARRFATADPRVRYLRNSTNIGAVPNFRRVLSEATGTYFTWLAHDDILIERTYVSAVVDHLERHSDVVLCATSLAILDYESPGSVSPQYVPEIYPERPWKEARREFFRWPQGNAISALHGMFRRAELMRVPISVPPMRHGRQNAAYWEMPVLAALCGRGRIVALPDCLRAYRALNVSEGDRIHRGSSSYDLLMLSLGTRLALIRCAWQMPLAFQERAELLGVTLANLFRANIRRPWDPRSAILERERERDLLISVAEERAQLIHSLSAEIGKRREIVQVHGRDGDGSISGGAGASSPLEAASRLADLPRLQSRQHYRRRRGALLDFFRPPPAWQAALLRSVIEDVETLRSHCAAQEQAIGRLHAEAEALLQIINTPRTTA